MLTLIYLPKSKYPESCRHIVYARTKGQPFILTLRRKDAKRNRRQSLKGVPCLKGFDRDEYPFACTDEGGFGADIEYIAPSDNRGAGAYLMHQLKHLKDGDQFMVVIVP